MNDSNLDGPNHNDLASGPDESRNPLAYRGWSVVSGGFVCAALAVGGSVYIFGLFVIPISEAFDLSRADVNNGLILKLIGTAIWSPIIGRLIDRFSARLIMAAGALLYAIGFFTIASSSSLLVIGLAILGPVAMGVTAAGTMAANTVTARWFRRRRGRAIGILAVATSAGGFTMTPIVARLIENYGWRTALNITGAGVCVAILLAVLFLVRDKPTSSDLQGFDEFETKPMQPNPESPADTDPHAEQEPEADGLAWDYRSLAKNRNFWMLTLGCGILLASDQAILASQVPYLQDAGISLSAAALFVSCLTLSAICGKLLVGFLADRIDIRQLFGVIVACHVALLTVLIVQPSYWVLIGVASTFGVAVGGVYPVWLSLTAKVFGAKSYGTIMGVMALVMQPISVVAIRFIGEVRDRTGAYSIGFGAFIACVLGAYFLVISISMPPIEDGEDVKTD